MFRCTFIVAIALFGLMATTGIASATTYPYYHNNNWYRATSSAGRTYYYTHYYYSAKSYHHCYYYPQRSTRYVYYYNWQTRQYWGRMDLESGKYSLLAEDKKKENLDDIKESDFPAPQALDKVKIPGTELNLSLPPALPKDKE